MKKLLLSMAAVILGLSTSVAKDYVLFGTGASDVTWTATDTGYQTSVTVDGENFTITTDKASSTNNLIEPTSAIRVYKNSAITIASENVSMKQILLTAESSSYAGAQTVSDGWSQTANGLELLLTSDGSNSMTMTASSNQFRVAGIVVSDEISSSTEPSEPQVTSVNSVAETIALASDTQISVDYPMVVAFVNYKNIFAVDDNGDFIQIYGENSYAVNDVVASGWTGTYKLYNSNTPEIMPDEALPAATEQKTFEPKSVDAADVSTSLVNNVVVVKNVEFEEATPDSKSNFTGKSGDIELSFRNNYSLESVEAGLYDVTVVVTIYQSAPSLYVIAYNQAGSGVDAIKNVTGSAEYYNLQGVRVANPEKGLYIRVEGDKATKVIF